MNRRIIVAQIEGLEKALEIVCQYARLDDERCIRDEIQMEINKLRNELDRRNLCRNILKT